MNGHYSVVALENYDKLVPAADSEHSAEPREDTRSRRNLRERGADSADLLISSSSERTAAAESTMLIRIVVSAAAKQVFPVVKDEAGSAENGNASSPFYDNIGGVREHAKLRTERRICPRSERK
jgi:hypothetical protein